MFHASFFLISLPISPLPCLEAFYCVFCIPHSVMSQASSTLSTPLLLHKWELAFLQGHHCPYSPLGGGCSSLKSHSRGMKTMFLPLIFFVYQMFTELFQVLGIAVSKISAPQEACMLVGRQMHIQNMLPKVFWRKRQFGEDAGKRGGRVIYWLKKTHNFSTWFIWQYLFFLTLQPSVYFVLDCLVIASQFSPFKS